MCGVVFTILHLLCKESFTVWNLDLIRSNATAKDISEGRASADTTSLNV
jgi:hypothetical protein